MNIAAYCRVSTEKEDQLNSLEAQKEFFSEYTKRTIVPDGFVVAVDDIGNPSLLGVQLLAELHPLGGVGALYREDHQRQAGGHGLPHRTAGGQGRN